jgi:hypothetical protein
MRIGRWGAAAALAALAVAGCEDIGTVDGSNGPPPPRDVQAFYYDRAVHVSWELHPQWRDEPFRIYGKRTTDANFFLLAEVTSCRDGRCAYIDRNITANRSYEYFVAAVSPRSGLETASDVSVVVDVPEPIPPPVPGSVDAVALDNAVFVQWDRRSRDASDFGFYRVYIEGSDGTVVFLGETDSEGFLDLLVENGNTYGYFVSAVDDQGHESTGSELSLATPRPDFHGEFLYAFEDRPLLSGFRFQEREDLDPILPGDDPDRDFRLEIDQDGWWLAPGPGVEVHRNAIPTTALKCGPAADAGCSDVRVAPAGDYSGQDVSLAPDHSYVLRVPAGGGEWHYGLIRVTHVGFAQDGAIAIFDWAFQLQPGNRALSPPTVAP